MYCCNGILFNHESPRRGGTFVTKKVTAAVARIKAGKQDTLVLGNIDSLRDWGHAKDYVRQMWMMLQQEKPEDFVVATGRQYTVRDFVTRCFATVDQPVVWRGTGVNEEGVDPDSGKVLVQISPEYFRPTEVETLLGKAEKAEKQLGWVPEFNINHLIFDMMVADCAKVGIAIGKDKLPFLEQTYKEAPRCW